METKLGVYLCSGCGIKDALDTEKLLAFCAKEVKPVVSRCDPLVCGEALIGQIKADIAELGVNRVIVAACSIRYFSERFDFGPEVLVDRVPIREFVTWTHEPKEDETTALAEDYLRMAAARAKNSEPPVPNITETSKDILVVGGGVAGMTAAQASADAGYGVILVEKEAELGGWAGKFKSVYPNTAPFKGLEKSPHHDLVASVSKHPNIKVFTKSTVAKTAGQPGLFDVTIQNGTGSTDVRVGAIVQATGWRPYDAGKLTKFGYGNYPNVVTNVQFEEMVLAGAIKRPSDGKAPKSVAIIHCAGSRDKEHLPYCSAVCCRVALKQALYVRESLPETDVFLLYKDIRAPGLYEEFYARTREQERVYLTKGEIVSVVQETGGSLKVTLDETLFNKPIAVQADLLVLATGMVPSTLPMEESEETDTTETVESAPGEKKASASAEAGAKILNLTYRLGSDLPALKYGFPDSHFICFPYETRRTAIYAAGATRAPMDIALSMNDGLGAALKAMQSVEAVAAGVAVHPRVGDQSFPEFFLQRCTQCKRCTEECPFGTLDEDEKGTPKPNPNRCRRCGICMGACPERIISFKNYSPNMISQMIKTIEIPEEDEEKPRVLAFMCENDAIPAFDIMAYNRAKIDPMIRIIPVRCIGSVNTIFIADALSNGFDGILLLGCQRGDDYQCHFIRGSELANRRMENVQEKLKQLVLEPERVKIDAVELTDWERLPKLMNDFAEEIRGLGANPYKGF